MNFFTLRIILCAVVATTLSFSASAQTPAGGPFKAGQIKAAAVQGQVSKLAKDGTATALHNGDSLTESDVVITGKSSSVVLVFMNASTVKLGGETRLAIEEFKMDDLDKDLAMAAYQNRATDAEPSISKTSLALAYGEMVGDVKHLNRDKGSSYNIKTPVGAAGIRGTIYRIVYRPDSSGKAFFQVTTADGLVVMQGLTAQDISIPVGQEVIVTIDVPTGSTTPPGGTPPPATTSLIIVTETTPETKAIIVTATNTIAAAVQATTFTAPTAEEKAAADKKAAEEKAAADKKAADEKAAADKKAADEKAAADKKAADEKAAADKKAAEDKAAADKKATEDKAAADKKAAEVPPPPIVPPPTDLTPGAGK